MRLLKLDSSFFLVKFPIIFPILYGSILYSFPYLETELILITILLLAETHFGATWPFMVDKVNYLFLKKNRINLIVIPIAIIVFSLVGFFLVKEFYLLIFFAANIYHVTRQSFGIGKLYCQNEDEKKYQETLIYIINFLFFLIGFLRFYFPIINEENIVLINILIAILLICFFIFYLIRFGISQNFFVFITGCIIFYPICFVNNPVHAIIMGVTMHYTQYLYFTYYVCKMRNFSDQKTEKKFFSKKVMNYFIIIIIYSLIMTIFSIQGKNDDVFLKNLIIVPIIGQMLHFYLDSQLWKFSDKYNRDNTLFYLKKII